MADESAESRTSPHGAARADGKHRPTFFVILGAAIVVALILLWGIGASVGEGVSNLFNPHKEQYKALRDVELGVRLEYFEESFGTAKKIFDPCVDGASCPDTGDGVLRLNIYETNQATVRALFEDDNLQAYLVTAKEEGFHPSVQWLGWDLGDLGQTTVDDMLSVVDSPMEATDTFIAEGQLWVSYVDVFAAGAPRKCQGLILASATGGGAGVFDRESADEFDYQGDVMPEDALARFREGTKPDTYGIFRDDGVMGQWLHEAEVISQLLLLGTYT